MYIQSLSQNRVYLKQLQIEGKNVIYNPLAWLTLLLLTSHIYEFRTFVYGQTLGMLKFTFLTILDQQF